MSTAILQLAPKRVLELARGIQSRRGAPTPYVGRVCWRRDLVTAVIRPGSFGKPLTCLREPHRKPLQDQKVWARSPYWKETARMRCGTQQNAITLGINTTSSQSQICSL